MADRDEVCVLIPTYNEATTIGDIVESFVDQGYENVLVVDGHSTDDTREIAADAGARVVEQSGQGRGSGKGQAVREGVEMIDEEYVLMLDGDGTYHPSDADAMLEPLLTDRVEHVIGNRFADMEDGAMPRLNQFGNRVINYAFGTVHRRHLVDILSGYRAFTRESFERLNLTAEGFAIETEMSVECVKHSVAVEVVPITYSPRPDGSDTSLDPFSDGGRIVLALYQLAKTNNPLFYFGSVGLASLGLGGLVGAWVGYEWYVVKVSHEVFALVSAFTILLGVQLLIFGVLSDMIVSLHREQLRRLRQIEMRSGLDGVEGAPFENGEDRDPGTDEDADGPRRDAARSGNPTAGSDRPTKPPED